MRKQTPPGILLRALLRPNALMLVADAHWGGPMGAGAFTHQGHFLNYFRRFLRIFCPDVQVQ